MGALGEFLSEEKQSLVQRGFFTADGRVDRQTVAQAIFEFMSERHISRATAVSNRALALHVCGITNPTPRLMQLISSLMNATGPVQKIINGAGGVLLRVRGDEKFESREGVEFTRNISLRWISTDDGEIWTFGVEAVTTVMLADAEAAIIAFARLRAFSTISISFPAATVPGP